MNRNCLQRRSAADEYAKVRRALIFIRNIVGDYRTSRHDHLGFSYAFAVALAEDLKERVAPASTVSGAVEGLVKSLIRLGFDRSAAADIEQYVGEILLAGEASDFDPRPLDL